jgi:hypothetical protein
MVRAAIHARTEPRPHQVIRALVGLLLVLLAVHAGAAVRSTVPLAGGAAALAEATGLRRSPGPARILLEVTRVIHDAPPGDAPGVDARRLRVLTYLAAPAAGTAEDVPLPLTPEIWRTILGRPVPDGRLTLEILADRSAALLYNGLYAVDDETLGWFAAHPQTLMAIYRDHAAIFAAFGRSVRISNGRVQPPGGSAYDLTWERLVGEPLARPDEFLPRLLSRGRGRMAFFYDAMAHLDAPRLRFALSGRPDDLYEAFSRPEEEWRPMRRPFNRTAVDGALLFSAIHVDEKGRLLGPPWSELWEDVFSRGCGGRGRGTTRSDRASGIAKSPPIDAAWLASRVVAPGVGRARERLRLLLFAQRVFPAPPDKAAEDVRDALCGVARAPALMLSLERMGVRDPELFARAAAVAEQSPGQPHDSDRRPRLVAIQSAIALLTLARQNRAIAADQAATLTSSAIEAAGAAVKSDAGPVIDWVEKTLVPAFVKTTGLSPDREPIERIVLAAAAGVRSDAVLPPVDWEGMSYRVDPSAARLGDAERVRTRQRSASLDVALAAHRVARGRALAADRSALAALKGASANGPEPDGSDDGVSLDEVVANPTRGNSEVLVADTLASMVYALSVGSSSSAAARAANVARRHELRSAASGVGPTAADTAWEIPGEEFGPGGWMVRGSLIGLDVGLSRLALRRQLDTGLPPPPEVSDNDRRTLAETVRLLTWGELADADRNELAAALARGRERARTLLEQPNGMATLGSEAAMDEIRRQALAWIASRDRAAAFEELWLSELARVGKPGIPADRLDAWGTAALPLEGGLAVRYPASGDACLLAGRPAIGMMAMTVPDIALRVVEVLTELKLPAALLPDVMAYATQLVIDDATTMHADDRDALAIAARRLPTDRMIDVVAALTASGPLVPRRTP